MAEAYDLIVIGAGPGGYTGAIRAAQLGLKTAVVEKDKTLGGTCLNVGCIPSKALLESSEQFAAAQHDLAGHGVKVEGVSLDLETMMKRKSKIVGELTGGIEYLFKKNKIDRLQGTGRVKSPSEVEVTSEDGKKQSYQTKNIMLATGSIPNELPNLPFDGKYVISSTEALSLKKVPKKMLVIGAGYIGLEMGSVWSRLGTEVTVIEYADKICGSMDKGLSKKLQTILKKQGLQFILQAKVTEADITKSGVKVTYENMKDNSKDTLSTDIVLVAAGRKPFSEGLGLEEMGIETDQRGFVQVDNHFRTKHSNIFAIGDLIPGPMLAHKAEEEGVAVAEIISGQSGHVNYETVPGIIYTWPEAASVGKTEEELKAEGIEYNVGTFPFSPNGRAKAIGNTDGFVKFLADKKTDRILGVHILGPRASDMISECVVAMEFGSSSEDIARSFHAHPTLSEIVREAALAVEGRARQM